MILIYWTNWTMQTIFGRGIIRPVPNRYILREAVWSRQKSFYPNMVSVIGNRGEKMKNLFERTSSNWVWYSEYEWMKQQFIDWAFTYINSFLYYEDYDTLNDETRQMRRQSVAWLKSVSRHIPTSFLCRDERMVKIFWYWQSPLDTLRPITTKQMVLWRHISALEMRVWLLQVLPWISSYWKAWTEPMTR